MFYAAFLGLVVYREMKIVDLWPIFVDSVKTTAIVMLLIGCASAFAWMMTFLHIPTLVTRFFLSISDNPYVILLMINILLLFLGTIMDVAPLIVIVTPVLLPVVQAVGMSPVTFGIVLMVNMAIGLPPRRSEPGFLLAVRWAKPRWKNAPERCCCYGRPCWLCFS